MKHHHKLNVVLRLKHIHTHTHTITFHLPRPQIHKLSHYKDKLMPYSQLRLIAYTDIKP